MTLSLPNRRKLGSNKVLASGKYFNFPARCIIIISIEETLPRSWLFKLDLYQAQIIESQHRPTFAVVRLALLFYVRLYLIHSWYSTCLRWLWEKIEKIELGTAMFLVKCIGCISKTIPIDLKGSVTYYVNQFSCYFIPSLSFALLAYLRWDIYGGVFRGGEN